MAHMQLEIEKQMRKKSPIAEIVSVVYCHLHCRLSSNLVYYCHVHFVLSSMHNDIILSEI